MIDKYDMFNWFVRDIEDWQTMDEDEMYDRILDSSWDVVARYFHKVDREEHLFYELTVLNDENWDEAYKRVIDWKPDDIWTLMRDMIDEWVRLTLEDVYNEKKVSVK